MDGTTLRPNHEIYDFMHHHVRALTILIISDPIDKLLCLLISTPVMMSTDSRGCIWRKPQIFISEHCVLSQGLSIGFIFMELKIIYLFILSVSV